MSLDEMILDDDFLQFAAEEVVRRSKEGKGEHKSDSLEYPRSFAEGCKVISLCGGATRFSGIMGAAVQLCRMGYKPDIILGVSAGAIGALPLALGLFNDIKEEGDNLTPSKFFVKGKHPVNKKGNPTLGAFMRLIGGSISLGEQDVRPLLRKVITEELWQEYKTGDYADVIVFSVQPVDGSIQHYFLKDCSTREEAFKKICASSRITPIVNPMQTENMDGHVTDQIDGGFRVHNPAGYFLRKYKNLNVTDLASIYSRPENYKSINEDYAKNFFTVTSRMLEITSTEVSKGNEREETFEMFKRKAKNKNVNHLKVFLPSILKDTYSTGEDLVKLRIAGEEKATEAYLKTYPMCA